MELRLYQADAFADRLFSGNPAAVCPLEKEISETLMQQIAMENNLAETAFYIKKGDEYEIRWFTPAVEVDLCGHATLAAAFVLFNCENHPGDTVHFHSLRSGPLSVSRKDNLLTLNFPSDVLEEVPLSSELTAGFSIRPQAAFKGKTDYLLLFNNEEEIRRLVPDLTVVSRLKARGVIVTARGENVDFVSRFFAPQVGVNEDPVTGSAHTTLIPYWQRVLGKTELSAIQLSARKGYLSCRYLGERVEIAGECRLYLSGSVFINE